MLMIQNRTYTADNVTDPMNYMPVKPSIVRDTSKTFSVCPFNFNPRSDAANSTQL